MDPLNSKAVAEEQIRPRSSKRQKKNPFLDIEADVTDDAGELSGDDDPEETVSNYDSDSQDSDVSSRARLHLQVAMEKNDSFLQSLTEKYAKKVAVPQDNVPEYVVLLGREESSVSVSKDDVPEYRLWEVLVKLGREESSVYSILERAFTDSGYPRVAVRSAFGYIGLPGRLFVEAEATTDVKDLCHGIPHINHLNIRLLPRQVQKSFLNLPPSFIPTNNSWIRLRKGLYHKDIALVKEFHGMQLEVVVVPRLYLGKPGKRKRERPPQIKFNSLRIRDIFGAGSIVENNGLHIFRSQTFKNGYLHKHANNFFNAPALPTHEELELFKDLIVDLNLGDLYTDTLVKLAIHPAVGEHVKVVHGAYQGLLVEVEDISSDGVQIRLLDSNLVDTVPATFLSQYFRIGDMVLVKLGEYKGLTAWVVEISDERITILNDLTDEHHVVNIFQLKHYSPDITAAKPQTPPIASQSEIQMLKGDTYKKFRGWNVQVTGDCPYKGYKGIIKETRNNGFAVVELSARLMSTSRGEQISLTHLSVNNSGKLVPILQALPPSETSSNNVVPIPVSLFSLTPSTPMPDPSSHAVSPAWNPSSRTPKRGNDLSDFRGNRINYYAEHWLKQLSPDKHCLRIQLAVAGTELSGFMNGDWEGIEGTFSGFVSSDEVRVARPWGGDILTVPLEFIQGVHPKKNNVQALVIADGDRFGTVWNVRTFYGELCGLAGRSGRDKLKELWRASTNDLVVC